MKFISILNLPALQFHKPYLGERPAIPDSHTEIQKITLLTKARRKDVQEILNISVLLHHQTADVEQVVGWYANDSVPTDNLPHIGILMV